MRPFFLVAGILSVILGAIGAALPIVPTVPFLLLAAFCFARSNPEWEERLLNHPQWGTQLRDWRERRAISRKSKTMAILAMAAGVGFTWYSLGFPYAYISIAVLVICGTWIATRAE
ncbi:YbaN family protein [Pontixanthobacter luteolus]|uniref:YbaN family protein n=1 Tax=Pontixanthobacter luteolus TaxID=295089 RepID=UPI0023037B96|nr:YbaN family protein [Pontixanthobacter luteolus]